MRCPGRVARKHVRPDRPIIITCQFIQLILCIVVKEIKSIFVTIKSVCYVEVYILTNQSLPICLEADILACPNRAM